MGRPLNETPIPLTITPPPEDSVWRVSRGVEPVVPDGLRSAAAAFRGELGLPTAGAVVMSGHQPGFWHAGILAKLLAVEAACERSGAGRAWVVVDHDPDSPVALRFPTAEWAEGLVRFQPVGGVGGAVAKSPCAIGTSAGATFDVPPEKAATGVRERITRIVEAMKAHAGDRNFSEQLTGATADLLEDDGLGCGRAGEIVRSAIAATAIGRTSLFRGIVETWRERAVAGASVAAYNAAALRFPEAEIRALVVRKDDVELPIWRMDGKGGRERVMASELSDAGVGAFVPRALFMTMLLRLAGCELFVHGLGGGSYDRVMEAWVAGWMPGAALAPSAVVTATVLLTVPGVDAPASAAEADRAVWRARAAQHDPMLMGDGDAAAGKRELVREIRMLKGRKPERAAAFARLQALLVEYRERQRDGLAALVREAEEIRKRSAGAALAADRTWAWALHGRSALHGLDEAVRAAFRGE